MRFFALELIAIARDVAVAVRDLVFGRTRARYDHSMHVGAARDIVWAVASARNITLDGSPPIVIKALPFPQQGVEMLQVRIGRSSYRLGMRTLERHQGICEVCAVVPEYTDHLIVMSGVTMSGFALVDVSGGTRLTMFRQGNHIRFGARISTPMAMRLMARRVAAASEQAAAMRRPRRIACQPGLKLHSDSCSGNIDVKLIVRPRNVTVLRQCGN